MIRNCQGHTSTFDTMKHNCIDFMPSQVKSQRLLDFVKLASVEVDHVWGHSQPYISLDCFKWIFDYFILYLQL
jgi:hypothetical protein